MNFGSLLTKRAILNPNDIAVIFEDRRYTYAELDARAAKLANALNGLGVKQGDRVAALMLNCSEFIDIYFASAKLGAIMVPVNFRLAAPEVAYVVNDSGAKVVIHGSEHGGIIAAVRGELKSVENVVPLGSEFDALLNSGSEAPVAAEIGMEDPQLIMYTSGTTGFPKGAVLTHGNSIWNSINGIIDFGVRKEDITLVSAPLFHIGALNVLTTPHLHIGATIVIMKAFEPSAALKLIEKERVTNMFAVPTMFDFMLRAPEIDSANLSTLRFFVTGGAPCPVPLIEAYSKRLGLVFLQGFGLTESSPSALILKHEDAVRKAGSVGKPFAHVDVRVVDEKGADVKTNEVGEIIIKGPTVMKGYWDKPEATAETIRDGWLHTGDLARVDEEGYTYIVDRKKDMIISGGENIYPAEIEAALARLETIVEAGVIGVPDERWGETPLALVVKKPGAEVSAGEVIAFCKKNLASYKCPKKVEFVESLPRTPTGKIVKKELRRLYGKGA